MFFMISVLFRETDYKTGEECSAGVEGSVVHAVGAVVRPVEEVVNPGVQFKQEVTHGRESMRGGKVPELVLGGTGVGDFTCFGVYLVDVFRTLYSPVDVHVQAVFVPLVCPASPEGGGVSYRFA